MPDQPRTLAEAEVIARHAGKLNWWAEEIMREYDRRETDRAAELQRMHADMVKLHHQSVKELEDRIAELEAVLPEWPCPSCGAVTRARMADAEPVLAPNALDASAERWQLYAAKLEMKLGELRGERDRLRAALKRCTTEAELRWSGKPMSDAEFDEFADGVLHPERDNAWVERWERG